MAADHYLEEQHPRPEPTMTDLVYGVLRCWPSRSCRTARYFGGVGMTGGLSVFIQVPIVPGFTSRTIA